MARQFSNDSQAARAAGATMAARDRAKRRHMQMAEMVVGGVMCFVGVCSVISGASRQASSKGEIEALSIKVEEAENALLRRQEEQGDEPLGIVVEVDATVNSAAEAGKIVCDYQNKLSKFTRQRKESGDNRLTEEHSSTLTEFRSYFVNPAATLKGTWCEYGKWQFESTYDYEGVSAQVTWMCYDGKDLLAVVTASYDGDKKMFSSAQIYKTTKYDDAVRNDPLINNPPSSSTSEPAEPGTSDTSNPGVSDTSDTSDPNVPGTSEPASSSSTSSSTSEPEELPPEERWMYSWSQEYQCWGYFDQDGNFLTEEQYNEAVNNYGR